MAKASGSDLDDIPSGKGGDRRPKVEDIVQVHKFADKTWTTVRLFGGIYTTAVWWVQIKLDDDSPRPKAFPAPVVSYNYDTHQRDLDVRDPWGEVANALNVYDKEDKSKSKKYIGFQRLGWMNGIIRSEQENPPRKLGKPTKQERKTGFKDKDSDTWTPVKAVRLTDSLLEQIKGLKGLNVYESDDGQTKSYSVADPKYGRNIKIYFDKSKPPMQQYQVQLGEKRKKLTEEEQGYLVQNLALLRETPNEAEVRRDCEQWCNRNGVELDMATKGKGKGKLTKKQLEELQKKKKGKGRDEDDEDEDDEDDEDLEDDEDDDDDEPKSKKKGKGKAAKKGKKSKDEDDDDDDDEDDEDSDDDDDDEDDEPKKKGKGAKKSKKSKDEDEDEDDDDEDDDDEDDEDDEDSDDDDDDDSDDEDDDDDDEDDEDSDDDDDDDEDEDDEDDEDDDDEDDEPKKKGKGKSKASAKKSAKKPAKKVAKKAAKKPAKKAAKGKAKGKKK